MPSKADVAQQPRTQETRDTSQQQPHQGRDDGSSLSDSIDLNNQRQRHDGLLFDPTGTGLSSGQQTRRAADELTDLQQHSQLALTNATKRRGRERSYVPDSILPLMQLIRSGQETQLQELLETAIEDQAEHLGIQVTRAELEQMAKEIFEQIQLALANGDLSSPEELSELVEGALLKKEQDALIEFFTMNNSQRARVLDPVNAMQERAGAAPLSDDELIRCSQEILRSMGYGLLRNSGFATDRELSTRLIAVLDEIDVPLSEPDRIRLAEALTLSLEQVFSAEELDLSSQESEIRERFARITNEEALELGVQAHFLPGRIEDQLRFDAAFGFAPSQQRLNEHIDAELAPHRAEQQPSREENSLSSIEIFNAAQHLTESISRDSHYEAIDSLRPGDSSTFYFPASEIAQQLFLNKGDSAAFHTREGRLQVIDQYLSLRATGLSAQERQEFAQLIEERYSRNFGAILQGQAQFYRDFDREAFLTMLGEGTPRQLEETASYLVGRLESSSVNHSRFTLEQTLAILSRSLLTDLSPASREGFEVVLQEELTQFDLRHSLRLDLPLDKAASAYILTRGAEGSDLDVDRFAALLASEIGGVNRMEISRNPEQSMDALLTVIRGYEIPLSPAELQSVGEALLRELQERDLVESLAISLPQERLDGIFSEAFERSFRSGSLDLQQEALERVAAQLVAAAPHLFASETRQLTPEQFRTAFETVLSDRTLPLRADEYTQLFTALSGQQERAAAVRRFVYNLENDEVRSAVSDGFLGVYEANQFGSESRERLREEFSDRLDYILHRQSYPSMEEFQIDARAALAVAFPELERWQQNVLLEVICESASLDHLIGESPELPEEVERGIGEITTAAIQLAGEDTRGLPPEILLARNPTQILQRAESTLDFHELSEHHSPEMLIHALAHSLREGSPDLSAREANRAARQLYVGLRSDEIVESSEGILPQMVADEFVGRDGQPTLQAFLSQHEAFFLQFPEARAQVERGVSYQAGLLRAESAVELARIERVSDRLAEQLESDDPNLCIVVECLQEASVAGGDLLFDFYDAEHEVDLAQRLNTFFGDRGEAILEAVMEGGQENTEAIALMEQFLAVTENTRTADFGALSRERELIAALREALERDYQSNDSAALRRAEELFGRLDQYFGSEEEQDGWLRAQIDLTRTRDESLALAIEIQQAGQGEGRGFHDSLDRLGRVAPEHRPAVMDYLDQYFQWTEHDRVTREDQIVLRAYRSGDADFEAAVRLHQIVQERYHNMSDFMALYTEMDPALLQARLRRYEQEFGRPLQIERAINIDAVDGYGQEAPEDRRVAQAQRRILAAMAAGEELDPADVLRVLENEAEQLTLARERTRAGLRSGGSQQWDLPRIEQDIAQLREASQTLSSIHPQAALLVDVTIDEIRLTTGWENASRAVWEMGFDHRHDRGVLGDDSLPGQGSAERQAFERLLTQLGIDDPDEIRVLEAHYQNAWESVVQRMDEAHSLAVRLNRLGEDAILIQLTEGRDMRSYHRGQVDRLGEYRSRGEPTVRPFLNKYTLYYLADHIENLNSGERFHDWLDDQMVGSRDETLGWLLTNPHYASDDGIRSQTAPNPHGDTQRIDGDALLERLTANTEVTQDAIALRATLSSEEPLEAVLEILTEESHAAVLAEYEAIYGESYLEGAARHHNDERVAVLDPSQRQVNGEPALRELPNAYDVISLMLASEQYRGLADMQVLSAVEQYGMAELTRLARQEGVLRAGRIEAVTLTRGARIVYDEDTLATLRDRREELEAFLDRVFQPDSEIRAAHRHYFAAVESDAALSRFAMNMEVMEYMSSATAHLGGSWREQETHRANNRARESYLLDRRHTDLAERYHALTSGPNGASSPLAAIHGQGRDDILAAKQAVQQLYDAMEPGWFGWGTDESRINETLEGLSDAQRHLAIQLYEVIYQRSLRSHFHAEMDDYDAARAFAHYAGDHIFAHQIGLYQATAGWGASDGEVNRSFTAVAGYIHEEVADEMQTEIHRLQEEAERLQAIGVGDSERQQEAARLHQQANLLQLDLDSRGEQYRARTQARLDRFSTEFDETFAHEDHSIEEIVTEEVEGSQAVLEQNLSPEGKFAYDLAQAIKDGPEEAHAAIEAEQRRFLEEFLRFRAALTEDGSALAFETNSEGELTLNGEVLPETVLRQYIQTALAQRLNRMLQNGEFGDLEQSELEARVQAFQALAGYFQNPEVSVDQIAEQLGIQTEGLDRAGVEQAIYTAFLRDEVHLSFGETTEDGDVYLEMQAQFRASSVGSLEQQNIDVFNQVMTQQLRVLPNRERMMDGTIFEEGPVAELWDEHMRAVDQHFQAANDGTSIDEFCSRYLQQIDPNGHQPVEQTHLAWIRAALDGRANEADAHRVRSDVTRGSAGHASRIEEVFTLPTHVRQQLDLYTRQLLALQVQVETELGRDAVARLEAAAGDPRLTESREARVALLGEELAGSGLADQYMRLYATRAEMGSAVQRRFQSIQAHYEGEYSDDMWRDIERDAGKTLRHTFEAIANDGYMSPAAKIRIATRGHWDGTDEDLLREALGDPSLGHQQWTLAELQIIAREFAELEGEENLTDEQAFELLRDRLNGEVSGDDQWRIDALLIGHPETVEQMEQLMEIHHRHLATGLMEGEAESRFREEYEQFQRLIAELGAEREASEDQRRRLQSLVLSACYTADQAVEQRNAKANTLIDGVTTGVVVIGSIVAVPLSGGTSLLLIGAVVGGVTITTRVGLGVALRGSSYSGGDLTRDIVLSGVDTVMMGGGAVVAQGVRRGTSAVVARVVLRRASNTARAAVGTSDDALRVAAGASDDLALQGGRQAGTNTGQAVAETVEQTVEAGVNRNLAGQGWRAGQQVIDRRLSTRVGQELLANTADGVIAGQTIGMADSMLREETWENGVWAGILQSAKDGLPQAGMGGGFGASFTLFTVLGTPLLRRSRYTRSLAMPEPEGAPLGRAPEELSFTSERRVDQSSSRVETMRQQRRAAVDRLEAARQGEVELSVRERHDLEVEAANYRRMERAQMKADVDAEMRAGGVDDPRVVRGRDRLAGADAEVRFERGVRNQRVRQMLGDLVTGRWSSLSDDLQVIVAAQRDLMRQAGRRATVRRHWLRERSVQQRVSQYDDQTPQMVREARSAADAALKARAALSRGRFQEAWQQFRKWQIESGVFLDTALRVRREAGSRALRDQLTTAQEEAGVSSTSEPVREQVERVADKVVQMDEKARFTADQRQIAWARLWRGSSFDIRNLFFTGRAARQASRNAVDAQSMLNDALSLPARIENDVSLSSGGERVRNQIEDYHLIEMMRLSGRRERWRNLGRALSDISPVRLGLIPLSPVRPVSAWDNLRGFVRTSRRAGSAQQQQVGLRRQIRHDQIETQALRVDSSRDLSLDTSEARSLATRYASAQLRREEALRFLRHPIESVRAMAAGQRNPLDLLTTPFQTYRLGGQLARARRDLMMRSLNRDSAAIDARTANILERMGGNPELEPVARRLAEANQAQQYHFSRFTESRRRILAFFTGRDPNVSVFDELRRMNRYRRTFLAQRARRSQALDEVNYHVRKNELTAEGFTPQEAARLARLDITARRNALRGRLSTALDERTVRRRTYQALNNRRTLRDARQRYEAELVDLEVRTGRTEQDGVLSARGDRVVRSRSNAEYQYLQTRRQVRSLRRRVDALAVRESNPEAAPLSADEIAELARLRGRLEVRTESLAVHRRRQRQARYQYRTYRNTLHEELRVEQLMAGGEGGRGLTSSTARQVAQVETGIRQALLRRDYLTATAGVRDRIALMRGTFVEARALSGRERIRERAVERTAADVERVSGSDVGEQLARDRGNAWQRVQNLSQELRAARWQRRLGGSTEELAERITRIESALHQARDTYRVANRQYREVARVEGQRKPDTAGDSAAPEQRAEIPESSHLRAHLQELGRALRFDRWEAALDLIPFRTARAGGSDYRVQLRNERVRTHERLATAREGEIAASHRDAVGLGERQDGSITAERAAELEEAISVISARQARAETRSWYNPIRLISEVSLWRAHGRHGRTLAHARIDANSNARVQAASDRLTTGAGREAIDPIYHRPGTDEAANGLAQATDGVRRGRELLDFELSRITRGHLPSFSALGDAWRAARSTDVGSYWTMRSAYRSSRRIERNAQRLHQSLGGKDEHLALAQGLAQARENYRWYRRHGYPRPGSGAVSVDPSAASRDLALTYERLQNAYRGALVQERFPQFARMQSETARTVTELDELLQQQFQTRTRAMDPLERATWRRGNTRNQRRWERLYERIARDEARGESQGFTEPRQQPRTNGDGGIQTDTNTAPSQRDIDRGLEQIRSDAEIARSRFEAAEGNDGSEALDALGGDDLPAGRGRRLSDAVEPEQPRPREVERTAVARDTDIPSPREFSRLETEMNGARQELEQVTRTLDQSEITSARQRDLLQQQAELEQRIAELNELATIELQRLQLTERLRRLREEGAVSGSAESLQITAELDQLSAKRQQLLATSNKFDELPESLRAEGRSGDEDDFGGDDFGEEGGPTEDGPRPYDSDDGGAVVDGGPQEDFEAYVAQFEADEPNYDFLNEVNDDDLGPLGGGGGGTSGGSGGGPRTGGGGGAAVASARPRAQQEAKVTFENVIGEDGSVTPRAHNEFDPQMAFEDPAVGTLVAEPEVETSIPLRDFDDSGPMTVTDDPRVQPITDEPDPLRLRNEPELATGDTVGVETAEPAVEPITTTPRTGLDEDVITMRALDHDLAITFRPHLQAKLSPEEYAVRQEAEIRAREEQGVRARSRRDNPNRRFRPRGGEEGMPGSASGLGYDLKRPDGALEEFGWDLDPLRGLRNVDPLWRRRVVKTVTDFWGEFETFHWTDAVF